MPARIDEPPPLTNRVTLRNPSEQPEGTTDRYGRVTRAPWGREVWANVRDRAPTLVQIEDDAEVREQITIITIRATVEVEPDAAIVFRGTTYESIGPPVRRGGLGGGGRLTEYLEIHAKRRA